MRTVLRYVVYYRFLLAACLVVIATIGGEYWLARPSPPVATKPPSVVQPPSPRLVSDLSSKFPKVRKAKKREDVEELLGPPTKEELQNKKNMCMWLDERENICIVYFCGGYNVGMVLHRASDEKDRWEQ